MTCFATARQRAQSARSPAPSKETTTKSGGFPFGNRLGKLLVTGAAAGKPVPGAVGAGVVGDGIVDDVVGEGIVDDGVVDDGPEGVGFAGGVLGFESLGLPAEVPDLPGVGAPDGATSAHPASTAAPTNAAAARFTPGLTTYLLTHGITRRLVRNTPARANRGGDR
ncbi:hypothetical protein GCM10009804_50130 [Kribbella hippodromi]|uniref:Uncharacterized protein n=1 Tax=Kribbella hippodromi TaxID=434347 RepID=A0ABP4PTA5_9ACTN